ncbi:MAG: UDP-N-acetylmuramoyl-L-alanine--D-glutamate ligase [Microgenomates group bacterium]
MINLADKKIAVLGLGIEGSDVVRFLLKKGAKDIVIFDQKESSELGDLYKEFKGLKSLRFRLGKDYLKGGLTDYDIIFRSPAFRLSMSQIVDAQKKGRIITSATKLFFDLCPGKIIGVTGTKGKGTTATLIYQILKKAGKKVFLAGNIGEPMLVLLPKLDKDSWVILELSSFQLQDLEKSPYIAVVLFITSEHLDYHKDIQEYIEAKSNIVRYQKREDFAVLNADNQISSSFADLTPARIHYFSRQKKVDGTYVKDGKIYLFEKLVGPTDKLQILGTHNWENVCAAITAGWLAGADLKSLKQAVFSFKGLEHRLELVRTIRGVSFYNDSFSTTPETAIAAIKAFKQPIILIAGGSEKGSNYTQLGKEIVRSNVKVLILIGKTAKKIKEVVQKEGFQGKIIYQPGGMKEIVNRAFSEGKKGDLVLLSPACASFDMFKNYKDRGLQFKKYVWSLSPKSCFKINN